MSVVTGVPALPLLAALMLHASFEDDFSKLWQAVSKQITTYYYARQARQTEMNRLFAKYGPIASHAKSRTAFSKAVNEMIAEFGDSHFAFYGDDQQGYYVMDSLVRRGGGQEMPNIGAWFRLDHDGYTVQMLLEGSPAEKAGLQKGDVVISADDKPFEPVNSFSGGGTVRLKWRRQGQSFEKDVLPERETGMRMFLDATQASVKVIPANGRKIGYVHLWTCASEDFRNALANAVYGKLRDTDAMVLDLRDGFGGRPEEFADPFFRPEVNLEWKRPSGSNHELFGYQRPLIVLINKGSRSAKEVLSFVLKKSHRATLVGSTTAGNVLGTFPMKVSGWAYLEIPMVEVVADGVRLEGRGVDPDVPVTSEFDAEGHDLYLAKALELLKDVKARA